jgi:hypothetical protein
MKSIRKSLATSEGSTPKRDETKPPLLQPVCTKVIKLITDQKVPPSVGISSPSYSDIDGFRFINIFVKFSQQASDEPPVDLGVIFGFDVEGAMGAVNYVILESTTSAVQTTNAILVSGKGSWQGSPSHASSYLARLPVMGPFVEVFAYNRAPIARVVSVWAYLVS